MIIRQTFTSEKIPNVTFRIEQNIFTGKIKLFANDKLLEQAKNQAKTFIYADRLYNESTITIKPHFLAIGFKVYINEDEMEIPSSAKKLKWYDHLLIILPYILLFFGGALGGSIGVATSLYNYKTLSNEQNNKYAKVIAAIILSYAVYFIIAIQVLKLIKE